MLHRSACVHVYIRNSNMYKRHSGGQKGPQLPAALRQQFQAPSSSSARPGGGGRGRGRRPGGPKSRKDARKAAREEKKHQRFVHQQQRGQSHHQQQLQQQQQQQQGAGGKRPRQGEQVRVAVKGAFTATGEWGITMCTWRKLDRGGGAGHMHACQLLGSSQKGHTHPCYRT